MDTVSAPHFRVFSVDRPDLSPKPYPGKLVTTGVFTDTLQRGGRPFGWRLTKLRDNVVYISAKYGEEFPEYLKATPRKKAGEMGDILSTGVYARHHVNGSVKISSQPLGMREMAKRWQKFAEKVPTMPEDDAYATCLSLISQSGLAAFHEINDKGLLMKDIYAAQHAKEARLGRLEGWVMTHQALLPDDELCQRLLDTGWYELQPNEVGVFRDLPLAKIVTYEQLNAATSG